MSDAALRELPNPAVRHDYLVRLVGPVGTDARLTLHYVPDRWIADAAEFDAYLVALSAAPRETPEALAARVLEDVNNLLVPRWLRVTIMGANHTVLIEDSQPDWENDDLMSALAPF